MKRKLLSAFLSAAFSVSLFGTVPAAAGVTEGSVCRIETTEYTALGTALSAVTEGKTIVLLTDIAYDSPIIANTRSFAIDLAGNDLSVVSAQVYCLAATGGKLLSVENSGAQSSLTITQAVAASDLAAASNYGAVYTNNASSRISIAANISTVITSNMIGVDASAKNSIQVGSGTVRADRCGISVSGDGTVLFTGDVFGVGSGADGISCRYSGDVQVNGTVYSDGIGVNAQSSGRVSVSNGITAYPGHGSIGAYATGEAVVQISGSVTAPAKGVFAEGGTVSVDGSVTGSGTDSIGALARDSISPVAAQGTVTVTGSVSGSRYGAEATEGGTILVGKDACSTAGTAAHTSAAAYSHGVGSTIIVSGNAEAAGQNSSGVEVYAGGTAEVKGNITAKEAASYGVRALSGTYYSVLYGSIATVDGTISANKYILIGATEKASNSWDEVTINGYLSFSGSSPVCYVFVKAPALQAGTPAASPAGGAVAYGTAVALTTDTPGAEIRCTLDGSVPTEESALYSAPIPVTAPLTIRAIAVKSGMTASGVMTEVYTLLSAAETPTVTPAGGAVGRGTKVVLATSTPGAEIRYTLDGSKPSASGMLYSGPISITAAVTVKAVAVLAGCPDSGVAAASFTILPAPAAGRSGSGAAVISSYSAAVADSWAQTSGAGSYPAGAEVAIHAGTRSGFTFSGWTSADAEITDAGKADASFIMPDKAVTVTAVWKASGGAAGSGGQNAVYSITKGANGNWSSPSGEGLPFLCDGPVSSLSGVSVDDSLLASDLYSVKPGSTGVTLKPEYLRTLAEGSHLLRLTYTNGYAQTSFTVTVNRAVNDIPVTGDAGGLWLWAALLCVSFGAAAIPRSGKKHGKIF